MASGINASCLIGASGSSRRWRRLSRLASLGRLPACHPVLEAHALFENLLRAFTYELVFELCVGVAMHEMQFLLEDGRWAALAHIQLQEPCPNLRNDLGLHRCLLS